MKRFKFPLQAVLTIRTNEERQALEAFARAQADVDRIAARQHAVEREIDRVLGLRRDACARSTSSEELQQMQHGLRALQLQMHQCQVEMEKAQAVLSQASRALLEARQKREVVEKVHDKQFASYQAEAARAEQKLLDEFATLKSMGSLALKWK